MKFLVAPLTIPSQKILFHNALFSGALTASRNHLAPTSIPQRSKFYLAHIDPQIMEKMRFTDNYNPYRYKAIVPNVSDISSYSNIMIEEASRDSNLKQSLNHLSESLHQPDCTALIVSSTIEVDKKNSREENYYNAFLSHTALLNNLGLKILYNGDYPAFVVVASDGTTELRGHQDSYSTIDSPGLKIMPYLVLLNANSDSNARTWIKESSDVINELEDKYPKSCSLLQSVRFDVFNKDDKRRIFYHHLLLKKDENDNLYFDQFSSRSEYVPDPVSLYKYGFSYDDAKKAIFLLKELVNKDKGKFYFCLNNKGGVQFAVIDNKNAFHGREGADEFTNFSNFINSAQNNVPNVRNIGVIVALGLKDGLDRGSSSNSR